MNNTYLSKIEIADLLESQMSLMATSMQFPDKSFKQIFAENNPHISQSQIDQNYNVMQEIFLVFLAKKYFISLYDITFKTYLKENDIPDSLVDDTIFAPDSNANDFSKADTINFIRNALCHNSTVEYCKFLVKDGSLCIEIDRTLKGKKFHVIFDASYLINLINQLNHSTKLDITIIKKKKDFDLSKGNYLTQIKNNLFLRRILLSATQAEKNNTPLEDFVSKAEADGNFKDFKFTTLQATRAYECVCECLRKDRSLDPAKILPYILRSTLPLSSVKFCELKQLFCFEEHYLNGNLSYNDICQEIKKEIEGQPTLFHKIRQNYKNDESFIYANYIDTEGILFNASTIYFGYLFDSLITDETVKIGKKEIQKNKLRNSFEHSRYYPASKGTMIFCDWSTQDELNMNWKVNIKIEDLTKFAKEYVSQLYKQQTNGQ